MGANGLGVYDQPLSTPYEYSCRCTVHRQLLQEVALRQMLDKATPWSARREWEGGEGSAFHTLRLSEL